MNTTRPATPAAQASRLIAELQITKAPIPVDKVARHIGALVQFSPMDNEISGMAFVKSGVAVIAVNSFHHPNRQRFTVAHEIGHLVMHRDIIKSQVHVDKQYRYPILMRDQKASQGIHRIEIEANQFAAELLMPKPILASILDADYLDLDDEEGIASLAQRFKVSKLAMSNRISSLLTTAVAELQR